jgi:hypothetical protein
VKRWYCPKFDFTFERREDCIHFKRDRDGERCRLPGKHSECVARPAAPERKDDEG